MNFGLYFHSFDDGSEIFNSHSKNAFPAPQPVVAKADSGTVYPIARRLVAVGSRQRIR